MIDRAPSSPALLAHLADLWARVHAERPLIHYLPNLVTANDVANALLAVGAAPIMAVAPDEMDDLRSDAVALNLGTPTVERYAVLAAAGRAAARRNVPIVLDPVGVGATAWRRTHAQDLLAALPVTVVRCNGGEAAALLGRAEQTRGVDAPQRASTDELAPALAQQQRCVVAVTGAVDVVSDGTRTLAITNGDSLLARITGAGCMATGVVAACVAVNSDPLLATAAALLAFGVAGERAAARAHGPGSLRAALFDVLYRLDRNTLVEYGRAAWR